MRFAFSANTGHDQAHQQGVTTYYFVIHHPTYPVESRKVFHSLYSIQDSAYTKPVIIDAFTLPFTQMPEFQFSMSPGQLSTSALTAYSSNPTSLPPSGPSPAESVSKEFLLSTGHPDYLRLILTSRVYDILNETPLTPAHNLSSRLGVQVLLKREDLQPVFSFKVRGAYNKMAHLPEEARWKASLPVQRVIMLRG